MHFSYNNKVIVNMSNKYTPRRAICKKIIEPILLRSHLQMFMIIINNTVKYFHLEAGIFFMSLVKKNTLNSINDVSLAKCRQDINVVSMTNCSEAQRWTNPSLQTWNKLSLTRERWLKIATLAVWVTKNLAAVDPFRCVDVHTPAFMSATVISSSTAQALVHLNSFYLLGAVPFNQRLQVGAKPLTLHESLWKGPAANDKTRGL